MSGQLRGGILRGPSAVDWTCREVVVTVITAYVLFLLIVFSAGDYTARARKAGDNGSYADEMAAVRGDRANATARHFVGYPIAAAAVEGAIPLGEPWSLVSVSLASSLLAVVLACRLWGCLPAVFFALMNLDWLQRSLLGGAEPLFAALLFGALLLAREERWAGAAALAAAATIVRPNGIFALIALALVLFQRRRFSNLAAATLIGLAVGSLYLVIVWSVFGRVTGSSDWYLYWGLGRDRTFVPFATVAVSYADGWLTWKSCAKYLVWMLFTSVSLFRLLRYRRELVMQKDRQVEKLFTALYLGSFLLLPAWWIEGEYPRYLVPAIPLLFAAVEPYLPVRRSIVWTMSAVSVAVAALDDVLI